MLRLPAIAEEDDPLGRAEGEPLWADDSAYEYGAKLLALRDQYQREGLGRDWYSQHNILMLAHPVIMGSPTEDV